MNRLLIPRPADAMRSVAAQEVEGLAPSNGMAVLAFVFGAVGFVTGAMAAHLPRLLELAGASAGGGDRCGIADGTGAGGRPALRVRGVDASARGRLSRGARRTGRVDLRAVARCRERAVDDLARDPAIGIVRADGLRAPHRHHRGSSAGDNGSGAAALRPLVGHDGDGCSRRFGWAQPRSARRAGIAARNRYPREPNGLSWPSA